MSGFAALMALSASQTKEAQSAVQTALAQRQRNEELKRKKQEEQERKAREEETKLRQKRFEDEKKQRELEARRVEEEARRAAETVRREEEARNALLYGPKKAKHLSHHHHHSSPHGPRWPMSGAAREREEARRGADEDDEPGMALTREEKRHRRMEAEMRRTYQLKRASGGAGRSGRRLPGGAIDATASAVASDAGGSGQSVKARLAALPNTLTKLNVHKRDTRTIDEILQDRARAKHATLDGDEAKEFNDWFGRGKKKELMAGTASSGSLETPAPSSGATSPRPGSTKSVSQPLVKAPAAAAHGKTALHASGARPSSQARPALSARTSLSTLPSQSKSPVPRSTTKSGGASASARAGGSGGIASKKRPRSPSTSLSPSSSLSPPPPSQRRRASDTEHALSAEIWKLFGKNRSSYVGRDVLSDDEEMEADASVVMKEELRSTRLAKREDEMALEAEKRHEEEKRRRKREREMRERQGM